MKVVFIRTLMLAMLVLALANNFALAALPPGQPITLPEVDYIIAIIADFIVVISGILAIIFIVWGGITYMAAGADTTKVSEAQERIKTAIIGTLVVMGVGVIINTLIGVVVTREFFFCRLRLLGICILR